MSDSPPQTVEGMRAAIVDRFALLSKRLQQIGRYALDEPNDFALETLAVIADRCGVQPSAIVRFAKSFGFEGASQMQRLYRDDLLNGNIGRAYSERVRRLGEATDALGAQPVDLLAEFIEGNTLALQQLLSSVSADDMAAGVDLITRASTIYVAGVRRSFPVASYLAYSLIQLKKPVVFIDGVGGLGVHQMGIARETDLLIAVSFQPYAQETVAIIEAAVAVKTPVLAISDSLVSPVAKHASHVLQLRESEVRGFRSLSASMCLAQALVINFAFAVSQSGQAHS